jgi:lipopolysaccharide assembly protein B
VLLQLSFLLLPVAATCGWLFGRREKQAQQKKAYQLHPDYFKGLNYLINEQPDKAMDVFTKLLEVDSNTVDMHLLLGNLFRRRGEVDRAIRLHQNLIARSQLAHVYREQALSALGQDYLKAGVLDRAESIFLELANSKIQNKNSLQFLLRIYQQEKDWHKAIKIAEKLAVVSNEPMHYMIAQYYCELALEQQVRGDFKAALEHVSKAEAIDHRCVRASIIRAELATEMGEYHDAIRCYKAVKLQDPDFLSEIVPPLVRCYQAINEEHKLIVYLQDCLQAFPRISIIIAIGNYLQKIKGDKAAINFVAHEIQRQPSLRGISYLVGLYVANSYGDTKQKLHMLKNFIETLLSDKPIYQCNQCGFAGKTLFWLCPSCHSWNTVKPILGLEGI